MCVVMCVSFILGDTPLTEMREGERSGERVGRGEKRYEGRLAERVCVLGSRAVWPLNWGRFPPSISSDIVLTHTHTHLAAKESVSE